MEGKAISILCFFKEKYFERHPRMKKAFTVYNKARWVSLKGSLKEEAPNCIPLIAGASKPLSHPKPNSELNANIFVIFHVDAVYCLGQPAFILHWSIPLLINILTLWEKSWCAYPCALNNFLLLGNVIKYQHNHWLMFQRKQCFDSN